MSLSHSGLVDKCELIDGSQLRRHFHDYFKLQKITLRINVHIHGVHTTIEILYLLSTTTEEKSPITICLDTTQYITVTLHMCYNFNTNFIISDIYGMTMEYLPFMFYNLMSSTFVTT